MKLGVFIKRILREGAVEGLTLESNERWPWHDVDKMLKNFINPRLHAFEVFQIKINGIPIHPHVDGIDDEEGIFPSSKMGTWAVRICLEENKWVSLGIHSSLQEAAKVFGQAEDYYEEFGIDPIRMKPHYHTDEDIPSQLALQRLFHYDPNTGSITWRRRFPMLDENDHDAVMFNKRYAGTEAFIGKRDNQGYLYGQIGSRTYNRFRVLWKLLHNEELPVGVTPAERQDYKDFVRVEKTKSVYNEIATHFQNLSISSKAR